MSRRRIRPPSNDLTRTFTAKPQTLGRAASSAFLLALASLAGCNGASSNQSGGSGGSGITSRGGDNSFMGVGDFFEGAMTVGYASDATDNAVQANIVAAGYGR